jgi:hypothetical protein
MATTSRRSFFRKGAGIFEPVEYLEEMFAGK